MLGTFFFFFSPHTIRKQNRTVVILHLSVFASSPTAATPPGVIHFLQPLVLLGVRIVAVTYCQQSAASLSFVCGFLDLSAFTPHDEPRGEENAT